MSWVPRSPFSPHFLFCAWGGGFSHRPDRPSKIIVHLRSSGIVFDSHLQCGFYELHPGCLAWLNLRGLVIAEGYGASRPLIGSVGQNHKENRTVEMHMRMSKGGAAVWAVKMVER